MPDKKLLIISFIGTRDLKYLSAEEGNSQPQGGDRSPIVRMLEGYRDHYKGERGNKHGKAPDYDETTLLLFDDDREGNNREKFCENLRPKLTEPLSKIEICREKIQFSKEQGPTNLKALYDVAWDVISRQKSKYENFAFHLSSGTPAMQVTLILAAECLSLGDGVRIFETSREKGLEEVFPPYVLAVRERREEQHYSSKPKLSNKERKTLLPHTVVDDPAVEREYYKLHKEAKRKGGNSHRVLVKGSVGVGKWHICKQFAKWLGRDKTIEWLSESKMIPIGDIPEKAILLIWRLDTWQKNALEDLRKLCVCRPDLAVIATYCTDREPVVPLEVLLEEGLPTTLNIELPSLGIRSDIVPLAEAMAQKLKIPHGKIKERFQYHLLTDNYPRNLHSLEELLITTNAFSDEFHPKPPVIPQDGVWGKASLLDEACGVLKQMDFSEGRSLKNVLDVIQKTVVHRLYNRYGSQEKVSTRIGVSQTTVSDILGKENDPDLTTWESAHDGG